MNPNPCPICGTPATITAEHFVAIICPSCGLSIASNSTLPEIVEARWNSLVGPTKFRPYFVASNLLKEMMGLSDYLFVQFDPDDLTEDEVSPEVEWNMWKSEFWKWYKSISKRKIKGE